MSKRIETLPELAEVVKNLKSPVAVFAHTRPDGDAIGSTVGMVELLRAMGKEAWALTIDKTPERMQFLMEGVPQKSISEEVLKNWTLVAVDVSCRTLIEPVGDAAIVLAIDHHESHKGYAQNYYVEVGASSACQIVAQLAQLMGMKLSPAAAQGLYAGVLTDTGRFAFGNAGENFARTLETAAWLVRQGAPAKDLAYTLTRAMSLSYLKLLGYVVSEKMEVLAGGAVVLTVLHQEDYARYGCSDEERHALVGALQAIDGVQMSAVVTQDATGLRLSVRAREESYRADLLCAQWGGGGHRAASGARLGAQEPLETFLPRLKEKLLLHWSTYGQVS